jgi:hypothetical protein
MCTSGLVVKKIQERIFSKQILIIQLTGAFVEKRAWLLIVNSK